MKYTQKWMVVPYDNNYSFKNNSSSEILRNRVLPSDVKSKLLNDFITKDSLKRLPEKQLPIELTNEDSQKSIELEKLLQKLQKKIKEEQDDEVPMEQDNLEEKNTDDDDIPNENINDYKNKFSFRKIQKAKRILESTFTQPVSKQSPKKTKIISENKIQPFQFKPEQEGPAHNTRQAVKVKLNTAQIGEGWLSYK